MNTTLLGLLNYILPSIVVFVTTFLILKQFLDSQNRMRALELKMNNHKDLTPIRLQAYERIVLFLERISPSNIIPRLYKHGSSAAYLQSELHKTIRQEFEHNLSQQIYVSAASWELVKNAKEETLKLVNLTARQLGVGATAEDYSKLLLEATQKIEKLPTQVAIDFIKQELNDYF